jgi:hypothetical protein
LYLLIIASGLFAEAFVRSRLMVPSSAAATAANIAAHGTLLRVGITADLMTFVLAIPVTLILYVLMKSVHKDLALLAVFFNIVQDAIGGVNALNTYRPLQLLGGANYLTAFTEDQLAAMASMSLRTHSVGFAIGLLFFGVYLIVLGYLVLDSRFFPKFLGVLLGIAGACYLINSLTVILSPTLSAILFPMILLPAFAGELAFALWLVVKGVDASKWRDVSSRINPSTHMLDARR